MELSSSSARVMYFNNALIKSRSSTGSRDKLGDIEKLALPHVPCFNEHGKQELKEFMVNLDADVKVKDDTEANKLIYEGVYSILDSVSSKIAKAKPQLSGNLIKMGSAHNQMKINKLDEFDFTYELDIYTLLNENVRIISFDIKLNRLLIHVDFDDDQSVDISEFDIDVYPKDPFLDMILSTNGNKYAERYKGILSKHGDSYILNTEAIGLTMFNVLDSVIPTVQLPKNWSHGGYNYPHYSGLRLNIPAYLMQFVYEGGDSPLHISVDFAPVLKLPSHLRVNTGDIVDEFLEDHGFVDHQWQRLECGTVKGGYNSLAEERWLSTFPANSVPKMVIRVCKALHNMLKLSIPKYLNKFTAEKVAQYKHNIRKDHENVDQDMNNYMLCVEHLLVQFKSDNDFATFLDIHEVIGEHDYVSSYIFKRIVMTMMVADSSHGKMWTLDDLPGLVLSVYMIVNDLTMAVNQATPIPVVMERSEIMSDTDEMGIEFELQPRSSLPECQRTNSSEILEQLEISVDKYRNKGKDTIIYERSKGDQNINESLMWYFSLHERIRDGKCPSIASLFLRDRYTVQAKIKGLDDGLARVFNFLRCIADGESKALINVYKRPETEDDQEIKKNCITRGELNALLLGAS